MSEFGRPGSPDYDQDMYNGSGYSQRNDDYLDQPNWRGRSEGKENQNYESESHQRDLAAFNSPRRFGSENNRTPLYIASKPYGSDLSLDLSGNQSSLPKKDQWQGEMAAKFGRRRIDKNDVSSKTDPYSHEERLSAGLRNRQNELDHMFQKSKRSRDKPSPKQAEGIKPAPYYISDLLSDGKANRDKSVEKISRNIWEGEMGSMFGKPPRNVLNRQGKVDNVIDESSKPIEPKEFPYTPRQGSSSLRDEMDSLFQKSKRKNTTQPQVKFQQDQQNKGSSREEMYGSLDNPQRNVRGMGSENDPAYGGGNDDRSVNQNDPSTGNRGLQNHFNNQGNQNYNMNNQMNNYSSPQYQNNDHNDQKGSQDWRNWNNKEEMNQMVTDDRPMNYMASPPRQTDELSRYHRDGPSSPQKESLYIAQTMGPKGKPGYVVKQAPYSHGADESILEGVVKWDEEVGQMFGTRRRNPRKVVDVKNAAPYVWDNMNVGKMPLTSGPITGERKTRQVSPSRHLNNMTTSISPRSNGASVQNNRASQHYNSNTSPRSNGIPVQSNRGFQNVNSMNGKPYNENIQNEQGKAQSHSRSFDGSQPVGHDSYMPHRHQQPPQRA